MRKLVRFDWAIKKLLRNKANFDILEGFLSELLKTDILIESILESEGNKDTEYDKYNRVDMLVKTTQGELMLVEVQNDSQVDYFQRMIYGISKLISEYIKEGEPYGTIKKAFSINIVYFDLGQGSDYIYEYKGEFVGMHQKDVLTVSRTQQDRFKVEKVSDIFPHYFILKINNFNDVAKDTLDEWIYFLKNSEIQENFKARGLKQAEEKLRLTELSEEDRVTYNLFTKSKRIEMSVIETALLEQEMKIKESLEAGLEAGEKKKAFEVAKNLKKMGMAVKDISLATGLSEEEIEKLFEW